MQPREPDRQVPEVNMFEEQVPEAPAGTTLTGEVAAARSAIIGRGAAFEPEPEPEPKERPEALTPAPTALQISAAQADSADSELQRAIQLSQGIVLQTEPNPLLSSSKPTPAILHAAPGKPASQSHAGATGAPLVAWSADSFTILQVTLRSYR